MNHFTIKDIENLSGIKAHTLRIWEKRYGIITPKRKPGRHRFYDGNDLKQILRITHLYNNGYKISTIANMQSDQLNVYETNAALKKESLINLLIEATIDLDEILLNNTLNETINVFGIETGMVKIIFPYLEKIGMLWMNDEALPAQERFASSIILKKIVNEIDKLDMAPNDSQPAIIVFAPLYEYHEITLLFMHYLFKKNKRALYYLGVNTSFNALDAFTDLQENCHLYFHIITNLMHDKLDNYVNELVKRYRKQKIIMSGRLTPLISVQSNNLYLLRSSEEMIAFGNGNFQPFN